MHAEITVNEKVDELWEINKILEVKIQKIPHSS
jgi:hypothetical protein